MSNNKQSSVEWLFEQIKNHIDAEDGSMGMNWLHDGTFKQAKAMHKEECIKYYVDSVDYGDMGQHIRESLIQIAEKMYNETFGGNNE